jgi:hypothetical protein
MVAAGFVGEGWGLPSFSPRVWEEVALRLAKRGRNPYRLERYYGFLSSFEMTIPLLSFRARVWEEIALRLAKGGRNPSGRDGYYGFLSSFE